MAPTLPRSTLDDMLDSIKKTDEKQRDMPPALPQRPTSRARLPSSVRSRRAVGPAVDAKTRQTADNHSKSTTRLCKSIGPDSPTASKVGSPPKTPEISRSGGATRLGSPNANRQASPRNRIVMSPPSPSGSTNVGRLRKDREDSEVNSNGSHKTGHEHSTRSTGARIVPENGVATPNTASSTNAATGQRKWKDESLSSLKKVLSLNHCLRFFLSGVGS